MDEEEALEQDDYADELRELEDDNELSIEELRRKYGYGDPLPEPSGVGNSRFMVKLFKIQTRQVDGSDKLKIGTFLDFAWQDFL